MSGALLRLARDERGATLATTAMLLMVLLGFVGVGLDVGVDYTARRAVQAAADAAAFSAAVAGTVGDTDLTAQARAVAAQYGLSDGTNGVSIAVNNPPTTGPNAGKDAAVEVIVSRPSPGLFSRLFVANPDPIRARAVALEGAVPGCMLALAPKGAGAVTLNGASSISFPNCSIYDNSGDPSAAMIINGGISVDARSLEIVGKLLQNPVAPLQAAVHERVSPAPDPYAGTPVPPTRSCSISSNQVWSAGTHSYAASGSTPFVFCNGGLTVMGGEVDFGPGTYVFKGGTFTVNGSGIKIAGAGVTFVFTQGASLIVNGAPQLTLSAPTSGTTAGLLFFMDPKSSPGSSVTINGSSTDSFQGAMYFPHHGLILNGSVAAPNGGCAEIIADTITVNGVVQLDDRCAGSGVKPIGGPPAKLVE